MWNDNVDVDVIRNPLRVWRGVRSMRDPKPSELASDIFPFCKPAELEPKSRIEILLL